MADHEQKPRCVRFSLRICVRRGLLRLRRLHLHQASSSHATRWRDEMIKRGIARYNFGRLADRGMGENAERAEYVEGADEAHGSRSISPKLPELLRRV